MNERTKKLLRSYREEYRLKVGAWSPSGLSTGTLEFRRVCLN